MNNYHLTERQRLFIVLGRKNNSSYSKLKEDFFEEFGREIYNSTISEVIAKEKEAGSVEDQARSGRPPTFDEREKRYMAREALKLPFTSLRDLARDSDYNPKRVSKDTIHRVLREADISSFILPRRLTDLSKENIKERKKFADDHINWDESDWRLVIFSDEADLLPQKCGREYIRVKEKQDIAHIVPPRQSVQKNISVKVWGAVSSFGVGPLVRYKDTINGEKYLEILKGNLIQHYPYLEDVSMETEDPQQSPLNFKFVDDNASSHRAKIVRDWKEEMNIPSINWPSHSPDLNIIENVWAYIKDQLYQIRDELKGPDDTWRKTTEIWNHVPLDFIEKLYDDLPSRIVELRNMKGGAIGL